MSPRGKDFGPTMKLRASTVFSVLSEDEGRTVQEIGDRASKKLGGAPLTRSQVWNALAYLRTVNHVAIVSVRVGMTSEYRLANSLADRRAYIGRSARPWGTSVLNVAAQMKGVAAFENGIFKPEIEQVQSGLKQTLAGLSKLLPTPAESDAFAARVQSDLGWDISSV